MSEELPEDVGTVIEVRGSRVKVEVTRGGGCKSCSMQGMCFAKSTPAVFEIDTDLQLQEGDLVQLNIAPGNRVLSAILVFLLPLTFLFLGYWLASRSLAELPSILIAFVAMALSFYIVRLLDRKIGGKMQVSIGRKL